MILPFAVAAVSTALLSPVGYEIECKSWPGGLRTKLTVTAVATDGSKTGTEGGAIELGATADALDVQICLVEVLTAPGWVVREGPNRTVTVYAPKGQRMKSIKFESNTGWTPVYRRVLARPDEKPKKRRSGPVKAGRGCFRYHRGRPPPADVTNKPRVACYDCA